MLLQIMAVPGQLRICQFWDLKPNFVPGMTICYFLKQQDINAQHQSRADLLAGNFAVVLGTMGS